MPLGLLIQGFRRRPPQRILPAPKPLRQRYDVVIIGGGGHGLATAYYLAKDHGIRNVAVLEKGYLAGGNTARNTAIVRSNYLTVEGVAFYAESVSLFANLSHELDFNIMYSERGHLTLAHTDAAVRTARWRAEVNKHLGVNSELIGPQEIARLCPQLNLSKHVRYPVLAALYHPPGAIVRHDAVAWGYAAAAARLGVDIHVGTEVTGIVTRAIGPSGSRPAAAPCTRAAFCRRSPAPAAASLSWRDCGCRFVPFRFRPAYLSRSSRSSIRSSYRAACTSMYRRLPAASSSWAARPIRIRSIPHAPPWSSRKA